MNGLAKTCGLIVIVGAACVLLAACGGADARRLPSISEAGDGAQPALEQNADIAEILAAPVPDGVDAALWEMLTQELAEELGQKSATQADEIEFYIGGEYGFGIGVAWDNAFMRADGSGNGIVDIADLSPIAMHYGSKEHPYADYNGGGVVNLADIVVMAQSFGLSCSGFRVEFSGTSDEEGFSVAGTVAYADYIYLWDRWRRIYAFPCETRGLEPLWVRVWVLDKTGYGKGFQVWEAPLSKLKGPPTAYYSPGFELSLLETQPPSVTWSTHNLLPDGNQDGVVNMFDKWPIGRWYGANTDDKPLSTVVDYNRDGRVGIADVSGLAIGITNGYSVGSFVVEVSAVSAEDGFVADGTVDYFDSAGFNEFGFRYYEYTIAAPPEVPTYWVRVVPYDIDGDRGEPGTVVQVGG